MILTFTPHLSLCSFSRINYIYLTCNFPVWSPSFVMALAGWVVTSSHPPYSASCSLRLESARKGWFNVCTVFKISGCLFHWVRCVWPPCSDLTCWLVKIKMSLLMQVSRQIDLLLRMTYQHDVRLCSVFQKQKYSKYTHNLNLARIVMVKYGITWGTLFEWKCNPVYCIYMYMSPHSLVDNMKMEMQSSN